MTTAADMKTFGVKAFTSFTLPSCRLIQLDVIFMSSEISDCDCVEIKIKISNITCPSFKFTSRPWWFVC